MILPDVHEVRLDNGFRALLVERKSLPIVVSMVWYQVGSRDELSGETGVSHFLEHMMFKGTDRYKKGEIDLLTSLMGGANNAFTDNDVTVYYFSLAADRWQTALEIEANRMRGCTLDEEEFLAEKSVVLEELAMGEDDPWRSLYQATESVAYQVHPYHHPVIGWRQDLERLSVETMRDYYRRHYSPDRAFLIAAGDIDIPAAEQQVKQLFTPIEAVGTSRAPVLAEPAPRGERRAILRSPGTTTRMAIAVRTCRMGEPDDFVLDVVSMILAGSKSSRLYKRLVLDRSLVTEVSTYNEPRLDPGLFWINAELSPGVSPTLVEACIREELHRLATRGVAPDELRRARIQLEAAFLFEEETAMDSAMKIGRWEAMVEGGYRQLVNVERCYLAVDSKAIKDVVGRTFGEDNWNLVVSLPVAEAGPAVGQKPKLAKPKLAKPKLAKAKAKLTKPKLAKKKPAKKKKKSARKASRRPE